MNGNTASERSGHHRSAVIELSVKPGDLVAIDQTILMVESEKATMDVPPSIAGRIVELKVALGDKVNAGTVIATIDPAAMVAQPAEPPVVHAAVILPLSRAPKVAKPLLPAGGHADLLVIGAGPGGYTAAFRAADLGRSVTLIDRWDTSEAFASTSDASRPRCCSMRKTGTDANVDARERGVKVIPNDLAFYCARHTFATDILSEDVEGSRGSEDNHEVPVPKHDKGGRTGRPASSCEGFIRTELRKDSRKRAKHRSKTQADKLKGMEPMSGVEPLTY